MCLEGPEVPDWWEMMGDDDRMEATTRAMNCQRDAVGMFKNCVDWHQILKICFFLFKHLVFKPLLLGQSFCVTAPSSRWTSSQVCNCHSVPKKVIREAIMKGAHTFEALLGTPQWARNEGQGGQGQSMVSW